MTNASHLVFVLLCFISSANAFYQHCSKAKNIFNVGSLCNSKSASLLHDANGSFESGGDITEKIKDDDDVTVPTTVNSIFDRRSLLRSIAPCFMLLPLLSNARVASAGIDPSALKKLSVEGDTSGIATRLNQIEVNKNRPEDALDVPFDTLPSGVSYREFREGKGEAVVQPGSKVAVEMTIRCKSFSTNTEPGGVKYFSTKQDTEFNELAFTIGNGEISSGLEEGMLGMHRGSVRRIEVPSMLIFSAKNANQLPLPTTKDGERIFQRLFKTDATLLFEVLVTRLK